MKITMHGFTVHKHTVVTLPDRGVVLVTGRNGEGKSSLVEAVAWALFGKTLRGTDPTGEATYVQIESGSLVVERARAKGKTALTFTVGPAGRVTYETTTKAQEALERLVGRWDTWRRCAVFSSGDASHFTLATDAERKRLLEEILGLDGFDVALKLCRDDLRSAVGRLSLAESKRATAAVRRDEALKRISDSDEALAGMPGQANASPLAMRVLDLQAMWGAIETDLATRRAGDRVGAGEVSRLDEKAAQAQARLSRVDRDVCPTCEQPIPHAMRDALRRTLNDERGVAEVARRRAQDGAAATAVLIEELLDEREVMCAKLREAQDAAAANSALARSRSIIIAGRIRAELDRDVAAKAVSDEEAVVIAARGEVELLTVCEQVLGMRGVRASILARALAGLEEAANGWLARTAAPGMKLRLKPYTEKKTGGVSEAISLEIEGAGGGHGYAGASSGERRRIDIAVMLALAETEQASSGARLDGALFFDEMTDALDLDGVEAVASVLHDLAETRPVVVITHSEAMKDRLQGCRHLRAEGGTLVEVRR